ncbi:bone morphogenetic protein 10 [Elysia marginata]|uniref:Bone morphogenetic protein 10 n=1 Tax=Elysia marginata TaxID=1093978 RepID=A0AAV4H276_9GAST|nr:bone morphogenetic protein 10 [Elysia marginata]
MLAFRTHFPDETKQPQYTELRIFLELEHPITEEQANDGNPLKETCTHIDIMESVSATPNNDNGNSHQNSPTKDTDRATRSNGISFKGFNHPSALNSNTRGEGQYSPTWIVVASKDFNISKSRWEGIELTEDKANSQRSNLRVFEVQVRQCKTSKEAPMVIDATQVLNAKQRKHFTGSTITPKLRITVGLNSEHDPILIVFSKKRLTTKPKFPVHPASRRKRDVVSIRGGKTSVSTASTNRYNEKGYVLRHTTKESFDFISSDEDTASDRKTQTSNGNLSHDFLTDNFGLNKDEKSHRLNYIKNLRDMARILDTAEKSAIDKGDGWTTIFQSINMTNIPKEEIKQNLHNLSQMNTHEMLKRIKLEGILSRKLELKTRGNAVNQHKNAVNQQKNANDELKTRGNTVNQQKNANDELKTRGNTVNQQKNPNDEVKTRVNVVNQQKNANDVPKTRGNVVNQENNAVSQWKNANDELQTGDNPVNQEKNTRDDANDQDTSNVSNVNAPHSRTQRSTRGIRMRSCRRVPMYVDFAKISWNHIFAYPSGYQAYQCKGRCYAPIGDYLTPTVHAVIQTRLHTVNRRSASRACCVPTKLSPISVIQVDGAGTYEYHYQYGGMVVEECGCR